jgi:hypothetical protein
MMPGQRRGEALLICAVLTVIAAAMWLPVVGHLTGRA